MDDLDQFYKRRYQERVGTLPPLQRLMLDLDTAVTGIAPEQCIGQYHHYPKDVEDWYAKNAGGNLEWYLSDGGYSRVVWSFERQILFLTDNSTSKAKGNWEKALPQRQAVERYMKQETDRLLDRQESRSKTIVNNLLEAYEGEPLPPKPQFQNNDDELEFHTKTPFNAYSHAQERGHHPRLWAKVKGSVYEPLYRKQFKVAESKLFEADKPYGPNWQPDPQILAWFRQLLTMANEGAIWAVPGTGQVYRLSKANKTMTLIQGDPNDRQQWHAKNKIVLAKLGWRVLDGPENPDEKSFAESIVKSLLDEDVGFDKQKATLQYRPHQLQGAWKWYWVLLADDGSRALATGTADSRSEAGVQARMQARKRGIVIQKIDMIKPFTKS